MRFTEISPWYIYNWKILIQKNTYAKRDNVSFLCVDEIQAWSNKAKTWNKDSELGKPKYNALGFKYMGDM